MAKIETRNHLKQIIELNLNITLSPYKVGKRMGNWFKDIYNNYYQISTANVINTHTLSIANYGKSHLNEHYGDFF